MKSHKVLPRYSICNVSYKQMIFKKNTYRKETGKNERARKRVGGGEINRKKQYIERNSQLILGYKILIRLITKLQLVANTQCAHKNMYPYISCTNKRKQQNEKL